MSKYDEIMGALDELGADELGADELGAIVRRIGKQPNAMAKLKAMVQLPGVPAQGKRKQYMGLGQLTFISGGVLSLPFSVDPQRPVIIRKLVIAVTRSGPTASGALVLNTLNVGSNNQSVNAAGTPCPVELFAPNVQDNEVLFDVASPGVNISGSVSLGTTPPAGETITVSIGAIVETVG